MHPKLVSLLQLSLIQDHVRALVVTSGLRRVWGKILEKEDLSDFIEVIGGSRT